MDRFFGFEQLGIILGHVFMHSDHRQIFRIVGLAGLFDLYPCEALVLVVQYLQGVLIIGTVVGAALSARRHAATGGRRPRAYVVIAVVVTGVPGPLGKFIER